MTARINRIRTNALEMQADSESASFLLLAMTDALDPARCTVNIRKDGGQQPIIEVDTNPFAYRPVDLKGRFFICREWRGNLTVETMRIFDEWEPMIEYARQLEADSTMEADPNRPDRVETGDISKGWFRCYGLTATNKPVNYKKRVKAEVTG